MVSPPGRDDLAADIWNGTRMFLELSAKRRTRGALGDSGLKALRFRPLEHADDHQVIPGMLSTLHGQGGAGGREAGACH